MCSSENVPEVELFSLLEESVPRYTLRADTVYGYSHDDWLHTPLVTPDLNICLSQQQIEETLKYFLLCAERVGQVTKTYHDIEAVTHLLEEKERDLELAARIGQSLLKQNRELTDNNQYLEEQMQCTTEEVAQLKHEVSRRDELLQLYTNSMEESEPSSSCGTPLRRNESSVSLQSYMHLEILQQKLQNLESENHRLKHQALQISTETLAYENKEEELVMNCVKEMGESHEQLASISEELARRLDDFARQQEDISVLLAQVVELQQKCRACTTENEELSHELAMSRESQEQLKTELVYMQEKCLQCGEMLREAQEEMKDLRNLSVPNSCINRYFTVPIYPMDSLAAEIEGTMRKGFHIEATGSLESSNYHRRVFETVRAVNQAVKLKSRSQSPQNIPGSRPSSNDFSGFSSLPSTPRTLFGSNTPSIGPFDKFQPLNPDTDSAPISGFRNVNPVQHLELNTSQASAGSGSATLHQWKQLAQPNLGGILEPRPGVLTKDFCQLKADVGEVYNLNDLEEDETDFTLFQHLTTPLPEQPKPEFNGVPYQSTNRLPDTQSTYTITTCRIMHPSDELSVTMSLHHTPKPSCGSFRKLRPTSSDGNLERLHPISSSGHFSKFRPIPSSGNTMKSNTLGTTASSTSFEELKTAHSSNRRRRCMSESATNLREHTTTMSTSFGLVTLLKEHGISAAMYNLISGAGSDALNKHQDSTETLPDCQNLGLQMNCPPSYPSEQKYTHPPDRYFLTSSLARSMLNRVGPREDRGSLFDHGSERNIFSFNLVEKLKRLGLDQVVAWGRVDPENKRLAQPPPTPST
ncbi:trafficking kinesin-binding protein 1-like isoform X2 [Narcine bancroftii]|uniref:trafficking kinesin-binding protein 1-like isoform X2 n=1 Tax=Narcine bancroftii TaxID=1343680 RepID=UPI0038321A69